MAARLIKSIFWLGVFSGLGYGLLITITPGETDIKELKQKFSGVDKEELEKEAKTFTDILKAASDSDKPFYRMSPEELKKELGRR